MLHSWYDLFEQRRELVDRSISESKGIAQSLKYCRYRFGIEQALAKASFLKSQDLNVLQAFVLYLVSISEPSRVCVDTIIDLCTSR